MAHFRNISCLFLALCLISFISKAQSPVVRSLDFFMEQGLNASPLLKDNKNQQRSNKIDSLRWRAAYRPQVTASSTGLYAPVVKGYGFDQALTNGQALEALLTVNYAIVGKGRIKIQLEQFRLQQDSLQFAGKWSELDLRKNITDQYLNSFASQQQMEFNKELYELLKKEELILKKLTRANTYKQSEYLTFLVTFEQQHLQWRQSEMQFKNDYATLNSLCGLSDTTVAYLKEPVFEQTYLADHTFFRQRFKLDSLRNENGKKAVDLDYKPKASVYVNGGYNSSFALQPYKNFGTSAGFTVSVPIYDGHQKKMQVNKLNIQQETTFAYQEFFVQQQEQQIRLLQVQILETQRLEQPIKEQIRFAKSLIGVDSKLMHTGDLKIADYIIAINSYLSAENLLRQTNISRLKLINQLNYWNR